MDVGQRGAQALGDRPLVGRVEIGEQQADRDRLGSELARPRRRSARARRRSSALDHALGADPLARPRSAAVGVDQRRGLRRAQVVEAAAGPGGRSRAGRRSRAVAISAVRAPRSLEQRVGADGHPVGEGLDRVRRRRRRARAPPRSPRARPRDWSSGVVGAFAVCRRSPSKSTASVKVPPTSTPSSTAARYSRQRRKEAPASPEPGPRPLSPGRPPVAVPTRLEAQAAAAIPLARRASPSSASIGISGPSKVSSRCLCDGQ